MDFSIFYVQLKKGVCPLCAVQGGNKVQSDMELYAILHPGDAYEEAMRAREKYLNMLKSPITQGKGKDKRWSTYVPDSTSKTGRRLIRKNTKEEVENAVIEWFMTMEAGKKKETTTVGAYWQVWYDFRKEHKRPSSTSLSKYRSDRKTFFDGTAFAAMPIRQVKGRDIEDFLCEQIKKHSLTQKRACQLAGYVKGILKLAYRDEVTDVNVWDRVDLADVVYPMCERQKTVKDSERVLSDTQVYKAKDAVLNHLSRNPGYMPDYAVLVALYTGLRAGELAALSWGALTDGFLLITQSEHRIVNGDGTQAYEIGDTKTHRERRVPVCKELSDLLQRIKTVQESHGIDSPFVFAGPEGRPNAQVIEKCAKRRGIEAGIEGGLTLHRIRRTVASRLNNMYDRATVAHILGHTEEVDRKCYDYDMSRADSVRATLDSLYA